MGVHEHKFSNGGNNKNGNVICINLLNGCDKIINDSIFLAVKNSSNSKPVVKIFESHHLLDYTNINKT